MITIVNGTTPRVSTVTHDEDGIQRIETLNGFLVLYGSILFGFHWNLGNGKGLDTGAMRMTRYH